MKTITDSRIFVPCKNIEYIEFEYERRTYKLHMNKKTMVLEKNVYNPDGWINRRLSGIDNFQTLEDWAKVLEYISTSDQFKFIKAY